MIKPTPQQMTHRQSRGAQIGLSYFFLAGFFVMATLQGFGYLKLDVIGELKDVLMLVMSFWFMRQRETTEEAKRPTDPTQPPQAANSTETPK